MIIRKNLLKAWVFQGVLTPSPREVVSKAFYLPKESGHREIQQFIKYIAMLLKLSLILQSVFNQPQTTDNFIITKPNFNI
jgi:hypothetical protein